MQTEEDPLIAVTLRIHRSTWRGANEKALFDEVAVCELIEEATKKHLISDE